MYVWCKLGKGTLDKFSVSKGSIWKQRKKMKKKEISMSNYMHADKKEKQKTKHYDIIYPSIILPWVKTITLLANNFLL